MSTVRAAASVGCHAGARVVCVRHAERGAQQRPAHPRGEPERGGVADRGDHGGEPGGRGDERDPGARRVVAGGRRAADREDAREAGAAAPRVGDVGEPRAQVIGVDDDDVGGGAAARAVDLRRVPGRGEPGLPRARELLLELNAEPDVGERKQHGGHAETVSLRAEQLTDVAA